MSDSNRCPDCGGDGKCSTCVGNGTVSESLRLVRLKVESDNARLKADLAEAVVACEIIVASWIGYQPPMVARCRDIVEKHKDLVPTKVD